MKKNIKNYKSIKIFTSIMFFLFLLVSTFLFFIPSNKTNTNLNNNSNLVENVKASENEKVIKVSPPITLDDLRNLSPDEIVSLKKLDMRNYNVVTPVKNQGAQGICWAYAFAAASEVNMLYKSNVLDAKYNNQNFGLFLIYAL